MTNPLKQGLKLKIAGLCRFSRRCRNDESTKTRIETQSGMMPKKKLMLVVMTNPLKQGLKRIAVALAGTMGILS